MKWNIIFLLVFSLIITEVYAQREIVLEWNDDENAQNFWFEGAVFLDKYNGLPVYQEIKMPSEKIEFIVEIFDIEFEDVSNLEKEYLRFLPKNTEVEYSSDLLTSSTGNYNRIIIFPYILIGNNYKRISKFKLITNTKSLKITENSKINKINSELNSGDWFKVSVQQSGVYSLDVQELEMLGINTNYLSINSIRLFGNGGGMLPSLNSQFRHSDLIENAIEIIDENNNGYFDNNDRFLFYAEDVDKWYHDEQNFGTYYHEKHLFEDYNYYFINISSTGNPKRIDTYVPNYSNDLNYSNIFNDYQFHEEELINFIQSGKNWYGEIFDFDLYQEFSFNFPNIVNGSVIHLESRVAARSFASSSFDFTYDGSNIMNLSLNPVSSGFETNYASIANNSSSFTADKDQINIGVNFNRLSSSHKGWLDFISLSVERYLKFTGNQMEFRKTISCLQDQLFTLEISDFTDDYSVWNVSDPTKVINQLLTSAGNGKYLISYDADSGISDEKFIAFDRSQFLSPKLEGSVNNQNLHGETDFEMLIVSHADFITSANQLSNFHYMNSSRKCKVVTPEQIYNEFSSGKKDIAAIRDYCRYLQKIPNSQLKYLLLIGDASYDPKDRIPNNTNFILTYQSENSISPLNTYATDDFFGFLDDNEGVFDNDLLDIAIGRLPAKTLDEANSMVNKIIEYHQNSSKGEWRNMTCFIADDGDTDDGNIHMNQAENLSNIVDDNYNIYNLNKIYLDAYMQESTPVGPRSPDAKQSINRRVEEGALIVNYTGHGGELGLTQERIIDIDQIINWENKFKLPLFITATCEFGRFDNPDLISGGEYVILNNSGGGIALLTTTRYVYSHLNYTLNTNFINTVFEDFNGEKPTLGDIFLQTKSISGTSINTNKFILLGDPMMKLSYPNYQIITTEITDTLSALGKAFFSGEIVNMIDSSLVDDFNGIVNITVYDKEKLVTTLGQESSTPMPYRQQNNIIYKGKSTVTNGRFNFSFLVPKDIDYTIGRGRISYYAYHDTENLDASGWFEQFYVGGFSNANIDDDSGPMVSLFMNDEQFIDGGITDNKPVFLAIIFDSSGINTVGNSIGHDITLILDDKTSNKIILNEYYQSDIDSYQSGRIEYPLDELSQGIHRIDFKIWDILNNSSQSSIEFIVAESEEFVIENLLNYPNPFTHNTGFYFEHNRPNQNLQVQIQIFTVSGKLVKTINSMISSLGFRAGPINWNGNDDYEDRIGKGTYLYKINVLDENGEGINLVEKLVILK